MKHQSFLPSFCSNQVILVVVVSAELLALVLALSRFGEQYDFWSDLALISLFIQWVALTSAAALCFCGPYIARLPAWMAALAAYGIIQLITGFYSFAAQWAMRDPGFAWEPVKSVALVSRQLAISSIVTLVVLRYFYVQQQWKENVEAEARSRLLALQARIRPHFLFNSMNTIASLTRSNPQQAEQATLDLADLFRSSLEQKERVSLEEELEITRRYLRLEELRLGERLRVEWIVDPELPLTLAIPALILQPLVENAIYHGIEPLAAGGCVAIRITVLNQRLQCTVSNPLPPASAPVHTGGNRIAQDNIRQRLALAYGEDSEMTVTCNRDEYHVSFSLPTENSDEGSGSG